MNDFQDPYKVLGVSKDASTKDIKRAYRKLAKQYHPDARPDDKKAEERFKDISEAYAILSDPEKRKLFDEFGAQSLRQGFDPEQTRQWQNARQRGGFSNFEGNIDPSQWSDARGFDPEDLFGDLFGFGGRRRARARGADVRASITLDFTSAAQGTQRTLHLQGRDPFQVNIPSGVRDKEVLRIKGKGQPAPDGGQPGDLLLTVHTQSDERFTREGLDLHSDLSLTLKDAILGGTFEVDTLDGSVRLKVPAGTQPGQKLRLKGKGIRRQGKGRGDLYVHMKVRLPKNLSEEQRQALNTLEEAYETSAPAGTDGHTRSRAA